MKKNIFSVVILALVIVNIILTSILIFSVVPTANKTNKLITDICSALELELESQKSEKNGGAPSIDQLALYDIADKMTVNLKKGPDGKQHYAAFSITISMDTKNEGYKTYGETIAEKESLIKNEIITAVSSYTYEEIQTDQTVLNKAIVERLQKLFDSDFIVNVAFRDIVFQ